MVTGPRSMARARSSRSTTSRPRSSGDEETAPGRQTGIRHSDENAEVVIFVDLGCAPPGFYIAPARETSDAIRARLAEFKARHGGQRPRNPDSNLSEIKLKDSKWRDHWNAFS